MVLCAPHLAACTGSMNLALAVVLAVAAATLSRAAALAVLVSGVPHFAFHAGHQDGLSGGEQTAELIALAMPVGLAALLLALAWRTQLATDIHG